MVAWCVELHVYLLPVMIRILMFNEANLALYHHIGAAN